MPLALRYRRVSVRAVDQVEVAVEIDVNQLQAPSAHTGKFAAALPSGGKSRHRCSGAAASRTPSAVHEPVLVEIDRLAALRYESVAVRVADPRGRGRIRERAIAVVQEQRVAGAVAPVLVIGREHVHVAVVVEVGGEQRAAEAAERRARRRSAEVSYSPSPWLTWRRAIESESVASAAHVAENFVEPVAVDVGETHVAHRAAVPAVRSSETHSVELPRRIASAADATVDSCRAAVGRSRQSSSFTRPKRGGGDREVLLADDPGPGRRRPGPPGPMRVSFMAITR